MYLTDETSHERDHLVLCLPVCWKWVFKKGLNFGGCSGRDDDELGDDSDEVEEDEEGIKDDDDRQLKTTTLQLTGTFHMRTRTQHHQHLHLFIFMYSYTLLVYTNTRTVDICRQRLRWQLREQFDPEFLKNVLPLHISHSTLPGQDKYSIMEWQFNFSWLLLDLSSCLAMIKYWV